MKKPTACIYCGSRHITRDLEDEHYIGKYYYEDELEKATKDFEERRY